MVDTETHLQHIRDLIGQIDHHEAGIREAERALIAPVGYIVEHVTDHFDTMVEITGMAPGLLRQVALEWDRQERRRTHPSLATRLGINRDRHT